MLRDALALWLVVWNLLAFGAMGLDKWKASRQKWRIRERTLILLAQAVLLAGLLWGVL